MSETKFKLKVLKYLKANYPNMWIYKSADKFTAGIPDLIICRPPDGKLCAIELKFGKNKATKLQEYVLENIRRVGGNAGVAYTIEEVVNIIDKDK